MPTALFKSNRSQAVRLSKDVAFPESVREVRVIRDGPRRILLPANASWDDFFAEPGIDLVDREQPAPQARDGLLMLRYLLDTNLCIRLLRDRPPGLRDRFSAEAASLCTSSIVLYELMVGAAKAARPVEGRRAVDSFAERLAVLDFGSAASAHAGDIRADLERRGCPIGAYDVLIAGHARSRGLIVITGNLGEFRRVEGLLCEDWEAQS